MLEWTFKWGLESLPAFPDLSGLDFLLLGGLLDENVPAFPDFPLFPGLERVSLDVGFKDFSFPYLPRVPFLPGLEGLT
jgi:hypothetical protein